MVSRAGIRSHQGTIRITVVGRMVLLAKGRDRIQLSAYRPRRLLLVEIDDNGAIVLILGWTRHP